MSPIDHRADPDIQGLPPPPFRVVIPARYGATRLPGKPLRQLAGQPLIVHVYRQARRSGATDIVVATDDERIADVIRTVGGTVCMTATTHRSGTDRIAEVARKYDWDANDLIVNVQGDEPLIPPRLIEQVAALLAAHSEAGIATLCTPITRLEELLDPHIVKVVCNVRGQALYFSRAPIPFDRQGAAPDRPTFIAGQHFRHIGLYAYRVAALHRYTQLAPAPFETLEALEQLRALWHGIPIQVEIASEIPPPGVDTEVDLQQLANLIG